MLRQLFSRLRSRLPLRLQRLEDRTVPALFTVTNLADSGAGSLRQAVLDANAAIGPDTILIAPTGLLALTSGSIAITDNLTIVGSGALTISGSNTSRVFEIDDGGLNRITVSLSRMTMSAGNATGGFGGVIRVADEALFLADVFVFGGQAVRGGGIDVDSGGQLTIDRSTISGNSASALSGGGISLGYDAVGIIRDSIISGNASGFAGGGVRVANGGTLRVERSQIHSNTTTFDGAGISMELIGDLTVIDSSIYFNSTGGSGTGGGINAGAAAFTLVNSTVSGNSAGEASGVYLTSYYGGDARPGGADGGGPPAAAAAIISSTIVFNSAGGGGGVVSDRPVSIANTIITGNASATTADLVDFSLPVFTARFSMVQDKGPATINDQGGMIYGVAPLLSPLQNNGGPTPTHALQADSRGLNEGDPAFVGAPGDQRGLPRVAGPRVDIGAVECEFGFVRGVVFNDANNNGVQDSGEAGAGDVFVWLDANGNGSPDNDEVIGLTNADGTYLLAALPAAYQPLHALRAGQRQTTANPAVQSLIAGVTNPGINYGNQALPGLIAVAGAGNVSGPVAGFRALLGGLNPNVAGTQNNGQGRREINWDGVPDSFSAPNALPANFFNANSPRGVVFNGLGTGFQVSADDQNPTGTAPLFGNFNTNYPGYFSTFSPQRLFTPVGTNVYDIDFFVPGSSVRATVSAFGAVFVDVDNPVESSLEFFDANGVSLGVFLVPQIDNARVPARPDGVDNGITPGLSFLGVQFTDGRRAAKVRVTGGNLLIGANDNYLSQDVVVVDDFIYSEPVAIAPPPMPMAPTRLAAIGSGPGGNATVLVYNETGEQVASFRAFDISFRGEVHVATADIDGDGVEDVICGAGPGGGPHVQVYNGRKLLETGVAERIVNPLGSFFAYTPEFRGGVNVASGDVDGDGRSDIIVGAGPGGGPHVIAYSGLTGVALSSFYAYDVSFRGGVNVAGGDFNGDGRSDIATGAGAGGGPHVRVFDVANKTTIADFFAYDPAFRGGVYVAAGDVLLNGRDDLITGAGPGGGPHVRVFDGATFAAARDFFAYNPAFTGGVRVGVAHGPGDTPYLFFGAGPGGGPHIRAVDRDLNQIATFYAFDENFNGGVFVG